MTRDLFGTSPGRSGVRRNDASAQGKRNSFQERAPPSPVSKSSFYFVGNRGYTRAEILSLAGFEEACVRFPDDDVVIVLCHLDEGRATTQWAVFPREKNSSMPPLWVHGEVMQVWRDSKLKEGE